MRVGILSMQRICNYGSFMQAFSLKKMIEFLGHEAVFIDFVPGRPLSSLRGGARQKVRYYTALAKETALLLGARCPGADRLFGREIRYAVRMRRNYRRKYLPLLGLDRNLQADIPVDVLVIGSDEVFNCLQDRVTVGFTPKLFGRGCDAGKVISYAASFGETTPERLLASGRAPEIARDLSRFSAISVRDANSAGLIRLLVGKAPAIHLDPVLVWPAFFQETRRKKGRYLLVYAYRNRLSESEKRSITDFAKKRGLLTVAIGGYQGFADRCILPDPEEIAAFVNGAEYIVTDTFHGAVFAILRHKRFAAFVRDSGGALPGNVNKLGDLLDRLGLRDRTADAEAIEAVLEQSVDYSEIDRLLLKERERSLEFLQENLKEEPAGEET